MATVVFEHSDRSGSMRLGEALLAHGHRLNVQRLHEGGEVPIDLDDVDAVLTCGGAPSATDDSLPWLEAEMAFLRAAHEADIPVLGICLGSQILGRALGGTVTKMKGGMELGWHEVTLTPVGCEDPLHAGIGWTTVQPHWHGDEVSTLPDGARLLASSKQCAHQCWAVGQRTYGIQYHPEIREDTLIRWAEDDPKALSAAKMSMDQLRQDNETHYAAAARLADRLFESIALLLMPLDRRYAGIAKDLHH